MSIAKSISTTLVGAAIRDGIIGSVESRITRYLPELAGSGYDGVSIRHVLQMTSGVRWDDTHTDENSERRKMLELQFSQQPGAILRFVAGSAHAPSPARSGTTAPARRISSARCCVPRWGARCPIIFPRSIWSRFGMEADATWWLESPDGLEVAGSGFGATLRDYGRFGLFFMSDGVIDGERVLPEGWMREATAPREVGGKRSTTATCGGRSPAPDGSYADGAFSARGIFGQYSTSIRAKRLVIAVWSARSKPRGAEVVLDNDFFNAVAAAL